MSGVLEHRGRNLILRSLKILASVTCLAACVLLICLWVRSYRWYDLAQMTFTPKSRASPYYFARDYYAHSCYGVVSVGTQEWLRSADEPQRKIESRPDPPGSRPVRFGGDNEPWRFEHGGLEELSINVPHWFLVTLSALSGISPWIHWSRRFSLRTLLIATTLVAVGLGLIAYMARTRSNIRDDGPVISLPSPAEWEQITSRRATK